MPTSLGLICYLENIPIDVRKYIDAGHIFLGVWFHLDSDASRKLHGIDHLVVELGAEAEKGAVVAVGVNAVGQQGDIAVLLQINPQ